MAREHDSIEYNFLRDNFANSKFNKKFKLFLKWSP